MPDGYPVRPFATIHLVLSFVVMLCIGNVGLAQSQDSAERVHELLVAMGYEYVTVNGCEITFERAIQPLAENGFSPRYMRYVNLRNAASLETVEERRVAYPSSYYSISSPHHRSAYDPAPHFADFSNWVRRAYPDSDYPRRTALDDDTSLIEQAIPERIPHYRHLDRWVFKTPFGSVTTFDRELRMSWSNEEDLTMLLAALVTHSRENRCDQICNAASHLAAEPYCQAQRRNRILGALRNALRWAEAEALPEHL